MTINEQLHASAAHRPGLDPACPVCAPAVNAARVLVTLERDDKRVVLVLRADDFAQSARHGKMRWGSGRVWTVVKVEVAQ